MLLAKSSGVHYISAISGMEGRDHLEHLGTDGRITSKLMLKEGCVNVD
jgi:hypothetical protein